jgi:hypothetical protein
VIRLDAATVLLQWSTGGLLFLWVTTRHRQVGIGYGWLLRGTYIALASLGLVLGLRVQTVVGRELGLAAVIVAAGVAFAVSVQRRKAGVSGQNVEHDRRSARVAAMTGIERSVDGDADALGPAYAGDAGRASASDVGGMPEVGGAAEVGGVPDVGGTGVSHAPREFPPVLDLVAPIVGVLGLVAAGISSGGNAWLAVGRTLVGAGFLGAVSDAMLLGHWYLVQPGLPRKHIVELVKWLAYIWPVEVALFLVPTGMISVFTGAVDDGWHGMLGWMWIACAVLTIGLCAVTRAALKEREYSAVMAATGLLYLAILTAFGTDLVARAVLAG